MKQESNSGILAPESIILTTKQIACLLIKGGETRCGMNFIVFEAVPLFEDSSVTYSIIHGAFASTAFAEFPYENIDHVSLLASPLCPVCENGKRCIFRIKALRVPVIDFLLRCALCSFQEARLSCLLHLLHTKDFFFLPKLLPEKRASGDNPDAKSNHAFSLSVWVLPLHGWNHHRQHAMLARGKRHSLLRCFSPSWV